MAADTGTLETALDQLVDLVDEVDDDTAGRPTPCRDWTVDDLVDHVVNGVQNFARGVRGEEVDWSTPTPHVEGDRATALRAAGDDLLAAWADAPADADGPPPEWQCSELAVHTWDLARGLGRDTGDLDPAVAERGATFMEQGLTDDNRGEAFGPAREAPAGADAYTRLAAFAGREV
ncbi:maleylpyruvate isomerase family mycothiol-dependent enzyme [Phycicoccus sp. HDW14]|uniref:maleylpyruvate isomerase family mycothiol-dependent enzyme n=1 Tax=Phycicoccus sp. HDW14 TaxID=2714941 RepID=UPI00140C064C|nr:maleylpyruvate isomerase family mycothiol-dependent enzyme [Phycicoccus sp. HDW14]QIM21532.1 maleylpyruvate isomerase family mycothiol-dependent enzyme [Phycicoccus sp. HDW14]